MKNMQRRKNECSKCHGQIEYNRVESGQKYCKECQRLHLNDYRSKKNYLQIGNNTKQKHYARTYANTYFKRGKIKKTPCVVCGNKDAQMHHDDYNKPLEVKWLCRKHHMDHHKKY